MLTAAQLRAARGLLDWTRADLAKAANVSPETIKNIEHGTFRPQEATTDAIIRAFRAHDVEFTNNEGVRKKKDAVKTFYGKEGYKQFLDDIYLHVKDGGITRQFNFSDKIIGNFAEEHSAEHIKRMNEIKNLDAKCLVPEGDRNFPANYCEYKWLKKVHSNAIPFYLYGNNVTMSLQLSENEIALISVYSELLAKAFHLQFDAYWEDGLPVKA